MTGHDARYAVELLDALNDLEEVRAGLNDSNWLEIVALDGDRGGGTHCGASLIPLRLGSKVIDFASEMIRKELGCLGVEPDGTTSPS